MPDVPEPLRGTPLLTIDGACIGDASRGGSGDRAAARDRRADHGHLRPDPRRGPLPDPHGPRAAGAGPRRHRPIRELSDEAIDAFAGLAGPDSGSPLLLTELRQLGGALGRPAENGGALAHLDAGFVMFGVGMPMTPELGQAIEAQLEKIDEAMEPWAADGGYFNFAERPATPTRSCPPTSAPASPR